jgi:hypothetical protein
MKVVFGINHSRGAKADDNASRPVQAIGKLNREGSLKNIFVTNLVI